MVLSHGILVTLCGILGNIISFFVFLAPLPTFLKIYKQKSTLEYSAIPYSVALFSSMLTLYYGFEKHDRYLITINSIGIVIESLYLAFYMLFDSSQTRLRLMKLILLFNMGLFGGIILVTFFFTHGVLRAKVVGFLVALVSICVFASPLSVMRQVIITKSVESLPAGLSLCLTLCALVWFVYGYLRRDLFIIIPNVLGLLLGFGQMTLYMLFKDKTILPSKNESAANDKTDEHHQAVHVVIDPPTKDDDVKSNNMVKIVMEVQVTPTSPSTNQPQHDVIISTTAIAADNIIVEDGGMIKDVGRNDYSATDDGDQVKPAEAKP